MNYIIQRIAEKVKSEIEENVIKILEGDLNLDRMVDSVGEMVNDIGIKTLLAVTEELNDVIKQAPQRKGRYHLHKSSVERTLVTRFGEFTFERAYYKNIEENSYVYILDELLDIHKYERIEGNLKGEILVPSRAQAKAADFSYQKASNLSSPVAITRESVKKIIRENGAIGNLELETKKKKVVDTIYIEADEDHVALQNGQGKKMKLIYVYDDRVQVSKGRVELKNKRYFTGEMDPEDMWTEVATYLYRAYDLEKANKIYIAGDGANWIRRGTEFIKDSLYVLDHYHLSKHINTLSTHLENLEEPLCIAEPLWDLCRNNKKEFAIELMNLAIKETPSLSKKESMRKAKRTMVNCWEGIINLFGEEKYKCSAEGHVSHILSARLSSRPMGWSVVGADEMARMRAYKASGGNLKEYYSYHRVRRKEEERIIEFDKRVLARGKNSYKSIDPDKMIDMPYLSKADGKWLKKALRASGF